KIRTRYAVFLIVRVTAIHREIPRGARMVAGEVPGSRTPLSTEVPRSNVLTGPSRKPRQLRGVIWLSEGVPRSEPPILPPLLSADAGRRRGVLAGGPL